jgi:hypothetical protein
MSMERDEIPQTLLLHLRLPTVRGSGAKWPDRTPQ